MIDMPASKAIKHIVALVLENRSFDHLLGDLGRSGELHMDGGTPEMSNIDLNGRSITINPAQINVNPDIPHDFDRVMTSLMDQNGGFVRADQMDKRGSPTADPARVMSYYPADSLPVSHALAREYATSDAWFASVPAGTWPNRLFLVAGSSDGRVTNTKPMLLYNLPTVFDRLGRDGWAIYNDQIPNTILIRSLAIEWAFHKLVGHHFRSIRRFEEDCASGTLPEFSFIEPAYLLGDADSGHPPEDILRSERLMGRIYTALRGSPLWESSVMVILYDEHGGLFDHVPPPSGVPSPGRGEYGFDFTRLGVRVPCMIVSPFAPRGSVWKPEDGFLDHTSLLATVLRRRGDEPLTARDAAAADIWPALAEPTARTDDVDTFDRIRSWVSAQERLVARDIVGPLSSSALEDQEGIDVAKAIVAAFPAAAPSTPLGPYRDLGEVGNVTPAGFRFVDADLESALVNLAEAVLALPPDWSSQGSGADRRDPVPS